MQTSLFGRAACFHTTSCIRCTTSLIFFIISGLGLLGNWKNIGCAIWIWPQIWEFSHVWHGKTYVSNCFFKLYTPQKCGFAFYNMYICIYIYVYIYTYIYLYTCLPMNQYIVFVGPATSFQDYKHHVPVTCLSFSRAITWFFFSKLFLLPNTFETSFIGSILAYIVLRSDYMEMALTHNSTSN